MAKAAENKTTSTAIAAQEQGGAVQVYDYGQDAGAGFENQTSEDYSIPFLGVLQSNSPEIETIDAAKPGMLINSVSNELFPGQPGVPFIPVFTEHVYVEWRPREKGGGIVNVFGLNTAEVEQARKATRIGKFTNAAGNELVETFYVYGIALLPEGPLATVITFASTKIKKYKAWMTRANTIQIQTPSGKVQPPLFAHIWRITTVKEKNTKGEFWNYEVVTDKTTLVESRLAPNDGLYIMARDLRDAVSSGMRRAANDSLKGDASVQGADGEGHGGGDGGKAPF